MRSTCLTRSPAQGLAFPKSEARAGSWLAANLISMANGTQAEEFLQLMATAAKGLTSSPTSQAFVRHSPFLPSSLKSSSSSQHLLNEAACEPEMRTIDLSEYTFTSHDPDVAVYPRCIRVPRCGGCCGPSDMLQCAPTRVSVNNVVLRKWSARSHKKSMSQELVPVEYHEECGCQCRIQAKDCDPVKQRYSKEKCKCVCLSSREHRRCLADPDKVWSPSDCSCRCRSSAKHCSTGLKWNADSCSCQVIRPSGDED